MEQRNTKPKKVESFILYNAGQTELKRADYIIEMSQYRTKCFQCRTVVQRVRSLLDEITNIKRNEILGICEHCKRANPLGKCRRCEYTVKKFLCNKVTQCEDIQHRFKSWLFKVNQLLHDILENDNVCKHKLYRESSNVELEKLLQELQSLPEMRQPDITFFPMESNLFSISKQSKDMLEELLIKIKPECLRKRSSDDSLFVSPSRTGKFNMNKKFEGRFSMEMLPQDIPTLMEPKLKTRIDVTRESVDIASTVEKIISNGKKIKDTLSKEKAKTKSSKEKTTSNENVSPDYERKEKTPKVDKPKKPQISPEEKMMLALIKKRKNEKNKEKPMKREKIKKFAKIPSLPKLKVPEYIKDVDDSSESVVNCKNGVLFPAVAIKGTKVVPFYSRDKDPSPDAKPPLLFRIDAVCPKPESMELPTVGTNKTTTPTTDKTIKSTKEAVSTKGIINYKLSDSEFVKIGWTLLPTSKIMRRFNIYKMEPASPKYDWFERHKNRQTMFYDTGEKLAEIDANGRGKWFYKNGLVALDYYNAQELNAGQRYVVYSSGEELIDSGKIKPLTVLASFDFLGNGVVYDHNGNVRLKYNQTEGIVVDEKIGPPGRWKWHSLNEPPILEPVYIENYVKHSNPCLDKLIEKQMEEEYLTSTKPESDESMLAIELKNFLKMKADKLLQKFKPFHIRMKVLKVNKQFTLRVLDQANIYLLLRDGPISLKLNLGMLLISSEIVDTETADVSDVATSYDHNPPKTQNIADIQNVLRNARKIGTARRTNFIPVTKSTVSKSSI